MRLNSRAWLSASSAEVTLMAVVATLPVELWGERQKLSAGDSGETPWTGQKKDDPSK